MIVRELVSPSAEIEAALWRYCTELDLVDVVEVIARPLDDPIRYRLTEPRQLDVVWQADFMWVRLLDIPAALMARSYMVDAEIVVQVDDDVRPDVAGRYRLAGSVNGAKCERHRRGRGPRVDDSSSSARSISAACAASTLALAGRVHEVRPGSLDVADDDLSAGVCNQCAPLGSDSPSAFRAGDGPRAGCPTEAQRHQAHDHQEQQARPQPTDSSVVDEHEPRAGREDRCGETPSPTRGSERRPRR